MNAPILDDGDVQLYHGDAIQTLRELPAGVAQTCITSPPYWGLRDYGTGIWAGGDAICDHLGEPKRTQAGFNERYFDRPSVDSDKQADLRTPFRDVCGRCGARRTDSQLGLEATPTLYVERMVAVFREVWRVLRVDGTVWLNLGDSYAGSWGNQGRKLERGEQRPINGPMLTPVLDGRYPDNGSNTGAVPDGLKPKDLVGIPWRVAFALQTDGWYLRSDIIWSKPNPMPESVVDRPTKAHEYLFLLSKQPRYVYDADAIREPIQDASAERYAAGYNGSWKRARQASVDDEREAGFRGEPEAAGRNRRSVWVIPTQPFRQAHFATFPEALVRPCVLAGTSERGECSECGAPWVREVERVEGSHEGNGRPKAVGQAGYGAPRSTLSISGGSREWAERGGKAETMGWRASCTCDAPTRPQTVLDPFIGSGTTALVARNHSRRCIGIDLSSEYLGIAARRLQQLSLLSEPTA